MKKLTPILYVDSIESCLPFWCERLGFTCHLKVPGEDGLNFAAVQHGEIEVMLQTRANAAEDAPELTAGVTGATVLFVEVDALQPIEDALAGVEVAMPKRKTFYGATEIAVREPGGHLVVFAEFEPRAE